MKLKKWLLALAAFAVMAVVCAVGAGAEKYGDYLYYYVFDDGTVQITDCETGAETVVIPDTIDGKSVTSIGESAFNGCTSLTSITIPNGVTSIGNYAFYKCSNLTSITIPNSVTSIGDWAFSGCTSLTSITIPNSVTSIGDYAFYDCSSLKSIKIPDSVTEIGKYAFDGCKSLTSITIPDGVTSIGDHAFSGCKSLTSITIPNSVTSIGDGAFSGCTSLKSITIPDIVTSIGEYAFYDCTSLTSITIPNSVTSICDGAFSGCTSLTSITIPDSITEIGRSAFSDCTSLTSITIPNSVTEIGLYAFSGCRSLTSIMILDGVTEIGSYAFCGCSSLTSITIPDSVTEIGGDAFNGCTSLTSITIPNSVTSIGGYAFWNCTSLKSIKIPDSVTSIDDGAFSGCTSLTNITIPDSVTSIGNGAFRGCTSLTNITIPDSVTSIGNGAFRGCTSLTAIDVEIGNNNYTSVNGVLFNKDKTELICYPAGKTDKSYNIPDSVTSIDSSAFGGCSSFKSITIPNSVTSIGDDAFSGCKSLTSITIPDSVTSIGYGAFSGCTSLTSITIPDGVTSIGNVAFSDCTSLTNITIPDSVTSIGVWAFIDCTSLTAIDVEAGNNNYTSVNGVLFNKDKTELICYPARKTDKSYNIPDSVTEIDWRAFEDCTSLTSITIPDSVTSIGDEAFRDCTSLTSITIPDSVTEIGDYAFSGCTSLTAIDVEVGNNNYTSVNGVLFNKDKTKLICYPAGKTDKSCKIPDSVTGIGEWAFSGCISLTDLIIPDDVMYISRAAFDGCISLKSITIPDSVMSIGEWAFSGCTSLKSVTIQGSVTYIGGSAFQGCTSLTAINVATGNQNYVSVNGVLYSNNKTELICYPAGKKDKSYSILDSVTEIGSYAFENCTSLTSVKIPNSVTKIDNYAFGGCTSLKSITIPDSVTYISDNALGYYYDNGYKKIDNFKIYCYGGTAGEEYAKENGFNYVLLDKLPTLAKVTGVKLGGRAADALRINWTKNANADGYIVEMHQGGKWARVAKITNNSTTTFRKAGLKAGTVYKFRVKAYKMYDITADYGEYSATVTARTNPSVIKGAKLGGRAADALRINWSKNASADGYIVEMYQGNKWVRVGKITSNSTTTFRKAGLKASTVYKFRVRAYKMSGKTALYGNYSATVTARTNPSIVKGVKIGGKAKDALRVNWTKNTSAQGYIVEMYKGGKWVRVAKITNGNTTTFRKAGLAKNTTYKFRVKAYYMSGKTALYGNYGSVSGKTAAK